MGAGKEKVHLQEPVIASSTFGGCSQSIKLSL